MVACSRFTFLWQIPILKNNNIIAYIQNYIYFEPVVVQAIATKYGTAQLAMATMINLLCALNHKL